MVKELDPRDSDPFDRSTALSHSDSRVQQRDLAPLSLTPDSGLPVVGVDSSDRPPATELDASPPKHSSSCATLTALAFAQRYTFRRVLGRGGMGEVRLCRDHTVGRDVAMKVIHPRHGAASPHAERRFVREARVQGQLEHPAIVPVYDVGLDPEGALYFTMKRVRGASLAQLLAGLREGDPVLLQRYSRRRLLSLFSQVCMAVHFGHQKGVVHRDLKPSNLMFGDFGEVYVLDWGLAGLRGDTQHEAGERIDDGHEAHTLGTGVMGTPGYMAPEQVQSPWAVDGRADVYALGAILFELLAFERMHAESGAAEALASTLQTDGASPAQRAPQRDVPPELDRLCREATRLRPVDRIPSAQSLSSQLEAYLDGDRDLLLRQELARVHAEGAREAFAESHTAGEGEPRARALALREVSAALGLDPTHEGAQKTLVQLITEPPRLVPAEAAAEIERNQRETYRMAARAASLFYFGYLLYLPLLLWMGIRDWGLFALGWSTIAACALTTYLLLRYPPKRLDVPLAHLAVSTFTVGCVSVMFGPFVLVPMLALGNCVAYISSVGSSRGQRSGLVPVSAVLAVLVPQLLRWTEVIPDNYVFADGTWTILPAVFHMKPIPTQVFLLTAIVGTVVPACLFVARLRRAYADAEHKLQLQAWQLRQFVPVEHT